MNAIEHNAALVEELLEIVELNQQGVFMDYELLTKAAEIGSKVRRPEPHEIDPRTGLSHRS